jgi:uncharacterized cupredoxin-like copper-binding protein
MTSRYLPDLLLPNPLPQVVFGAWSAAAYNEKSPLQRGFLEEPTPGFEPGTPRYEDGSRVMARWKLRAPPGVINREKIHFPPLEEPMTLERTSAAAFVAVLLAATVIAGCGSNDNQSSSTTNTTPTAATNTTPATSGKGSTLKLSADPGGALKFNTSSLQAKSGTVSLVMTNPSSSGIQHGIAVEGNGVDKDGPIVGPGKTSNLTVKLKPGKYEFYCPFDGHKAQGMTGTLTVK